MGDLNVFEIIGRQQVELIALHQQVAELQEMIKQLKENKEDD